jgi:hypothetical protein
VLPQNIPLVLEWQSSWYYEFGVTRYLDNGWHVSGGYIFNEKLDSPTRITRRWLPTLTGIS